MQIAVEIKLEQHRRIVRRTSGVGATGLGESQHVQIQGRHKGVQEPHGIFGGDVFLQPFRKEQRL